MQEVAAPPPNAGFIVLRLPLRDTDDEDIAGRFTEACDFIDAVLASPTQPEAVQVQWRE
jgi:hypothetical protein